MKSIDYSKVKVNGGFWSEKQKMIRDTTVKAVYDRFCDTYRFSALECKWREGDPHKPHLYWDSDVAKWCEGVSYLLTFEDNAEWRAIIERVIDAFVDECSMCPYKPTNDDEKNCVDRTQRDALELLKECMPRVIDISEIYTAKKLDVWLEDKSDIVHPLMLIETEMTNKSQTAFFYPMLVRPIKAYGKTWRVWTARPTDEQREAVKWE